MSKNFKSFCEIIQFAIAREEEAVDFYEALADLVNDDAVKAEARKMAAQEEGHKHILEAIEAEQIKSEEVNVSTELMGISEWAVESPVSEEMSYQDLIILAMKREANSAKLYYELAEQVKDSQLKSLFKKLSVDESAHLDHFESLYDENFLIEN